jgi:N-acetyltransferase 10
MRGRKGLNHQKDIAYLKLLSNCVFPEPDIHFLQFLSLLIDVHFCSQNSPNDLQMMSDAPAHHLFCLLGPVDPNQKSLPEVLVVIQVRN